MAERDVVIVGAGIGGLATALELTAAGYDVTVVEKAPAVGGKMRTVEVEGRAIDSGPTVLTMREVFDGLFERTGTRLEDHVNLRPMAVLARHAWADGTRLDLYADPERSARAIAEAFGRREAKGFDRFRAHTKKIHDAVRGPFIEDDAAGLLAMARNLSFKQMRQMAAVDWHRSVWKALGSFFREPKLRQLFGRYSTYYGSSPFQAPATLNLIAHVEQQGVWAVGGGMIELARAMASRIEALGGTILLGRAVSRIRMDNRRATGVELDDGTELPARAVVLNTVPEALAAGLMGEAPKRAVKAGGSPRSLSAITWSMVGRVRDFGLAYHNVLFSDDYRREFDQLRAGQVPDDPTVYLCAQDRDPTALTLGTDPGLQRLFCLINAPARGDDPDFQPRIDQCHARCFERMSRCGLTVEAEPSATICTTPHDFARMFPASGGALYGPATHSFMASFSRPGARTRVPGLYLVGGGAHPGAGVPMVALGGRLAARSVHGDFASTQRSLPAATFGGTSTASATTAAMP